MKTFFQIVALASLLIIANLSFAQDFVNPDLDGVIVGEFSLPENWEAVPYTDANCIATTALYATPDLTDLSLPDAQNGIIGNPFSGNTFISGRRSITTSGEHVQEGIMQKVSGFEIGRFYTINFHQTVVKQKYAIDNSGSWAVYLDNSLIQVTPPTTSNEPYNSTNLMWESRLVQFEATSTEHTIKFLPYDDDSNLDPSETNPTGALRMGIDSITIICINNDLGDNRDLCEGDTLILEAPPKGSYVWQDGSTNDCFVVTSEGWYKLEMTNYCGFDLDSIYVGYDVKPDIDLGNDTAICYGDTLRLDAYSPNAYYGWEPEPTIISWDDVYFVLNPGQYNVEVITSGCDVVRDSIYIDMFDCSVLVLPNIITPNGDSINDLLTPIQRERVVSMNTRIFNRWGKEVFSTSDLNINWDGSNCADGMYFYQIDYYGIGPELLIRKGYIHLVR